VSPCHRAVSVYDLDGPLAIAPRAGNPGLGHLLGRAVPPLQCCPDTRAPRRRRLPAFRAADRLLLSISEHFISSSPSVPRRAPKAIPLALRRLLRRSRASPFPSAGEGLFSIPFRNVE